MANPVWISLVSCAKLDPKILVIFITGHGNSDTAIEAMKLGAFDYLVKPLDLAQLKQVVGQALKISQLMHTPAAVDTPMHVADASDRLIGSGPAMQSICKRIGRIALQNVNVLVLGESGTGKELVAPCDLPPQSQKSGSVSGDQLRRDS